MIGAKNHAIVLNDCDLEDTVTKVIAGAFGSAGRRCMAAAVICVEEGIADRFITRFVKIGDGLSSDTFLGPVIRPETRNRILDYIEKGKSQGARLLLWEDQSDVPSRGFL